MVQFSEFTRRYGSFTAVDALTMEIPKGAIFGLLGPNGAGKTTTVKCLTGVLRPTLGRILVEGIDVAERPLEVKRLVGYVPENPVLFKSLTGREVLTLAGRLHHLEEAPLASRIAELLHAFGISGKADEQVQSYSKGTAQKVVIAAALIHNPRVVVLDEGLSGLDAPAAAVLKRLLRSFASAGRTVIFCSHVLEVVERLCDRIAIIAEGRVKAEGTVGEILAQSRATTLEQAFITLTGETDVAREAEDILGALGGGGK
jgi:ABC-2 type transport system ATP-binding protein